MGSDLGVDPGPCSGSGASGASVTAELVELLRGLAADAGVHRDSAELMAIARDLEVARSLLESASGRIGAALDFRQVTVRSSGLKTGAWLAQEPRQSVAGCRRRVKVGCRLRNEFTKLEAAVAEGRLSWNHAEVVVRVANRRIRAQLTQIQDSLIEAAQEVVFERWEEFVVGLARQLDLDGGHDPSKDLAANRLQLHMDGQGALLLDGELVGADALVTETAIDKVADELFVKYSGDSERAGGELPVPDRAMLRALALAEICRRANGVRPGRPPVNLTTMVVHSDDPAGTAYTPDGGVFPAGMVELLRCDESVETLVMSSTGVPLYMGRARRLATPHQARVIAVRDGGCVFPGCADPASRCVNHHVRHWKRDTGHTNTDEMAALCPHHHGVVHSTGWEMRLSDQEWFEFTTPEGRTLLSQRHGSTRDHPRQDRGVAGTCRDGHAGGDPPGRCAAA